MPVMTDALMLLLYLLLASTSTHAHTLRLGKPAPSSGLSSSSTHRFPEDVYAQPAFRVRLDGSTVANSTAYGIVNPAGKTDAAIAHDSSSSSARPPHPHAVIMHTAPSIAHLCTLSPPLRSRGGGAHRANDSLALTPANLLSQRHRVIRTGLTLLAPLKGNCLYYTSDWFTYSLCLGEAVRQFRALPNTVGTGKVPAQDPSQHAFVLGRWRQDLEVVGGQLYNHYTPRGQGDDEQHAALHQLTTSLGISAQEATSTSLTSTSAHRVSDLLDNQDDDNGTELMEVITFDDGDGDDKQRYLSQLWSDGTLCDINNEPRTIEVQYHCNGALSASQITLIKETTTCHYVLVVETPLVCKEPSLRGSAGASASHHEQQRRKRVGEWKCSRIVGDDDRVGGDVADVADVSRQAEYVEEQVQSEQPQSHDMAAQEVADGDGDGVAVTVGEINVQEAEASTDAQDPDMLDSEDAGAGADAEEGLLGDLLHGGAGVIGGPIEIQLDGRDIQQLLAAQRGGDGDDVQDIEAALAEIVEGELSKLEEGQETDEDDADSTRADDTDARLERLRSRLSSITDALMQARDGESEGDNANANERDGSASIFNELNRDVRGEEAHGGEAPVLKEKAPRQIQAAREEQQVKPDGKRKPTFHGPAAAAAARVDTLADRAQRFYDERQRRRDGEKDEDKGRAVKDEL